MTTEDLSKLSIEQLEELFSALDEDSLREMVTAAKEIERRLIEDGPKTDDELWVWVKSNLGIEISRTPVCKGHDAPFKFLADAYFNRYPAILAMGNRSGGKTFLVALLHWLNSEFKPGIESCTFGATEAQSLRCYSHLRGWIYDDDGNKRPEIASSIMRETVWRKKDGMTAGSKVEVLAGTPDAVNGPHPQIVHGDEVELMRQDTWDESRNMATSKTVKPNSPEETNYPSQEILTSTRKSLHGRMQELIDGITEAKKLGMKPAYHLIIWCIFEIAQEVPNCQMAPKGEREKRLTELGKDPCSKCECHLHMKGKWPKGAGKKLEGKPRLLKDVCKGRLFRSRGHFPYADVVQKFMQNSPFTWEAQQECAKPETEFNYLKGFSEEANGIRGFEPDPEQGEIFEGIDWGGTNPHAVNLYQLLDVEVKVLSFLEEEITIPQGSLVCFDEIYQAEIGTERLAKLVKRMEAKWTEVFPNFRIAKRIADPQGKSQRIDFRDEYDLPTEWKSTRDFDTQVEWLVREWWEAGLIYYVVGGLGEVEMFPLEAQSWQRDPNTGKQVDEFNHCMSNLRYVTANIRTTKRRGRRGKSVPKARGRYRTAGVVKDTRRQLSGPIAVTGRGRGGPEEWRKKLGGPGMGGGGF